MSDISNVKITCELTGSGESESIHRDEREQPGINTKNWEPRTPPRPRPVLGKITGFRGYQTKASGGILFFFLLYSNSTFLEGCINSEQFVKSEIGMEHLLFPLFYLLLHFSLHHVYQRSDTFDNRVMMSSRPPCVLQCSEPLFVPEGVDFD